MRIDIYIFQEGDAYIATSSVGPGFSAYGDTVSDCLREAATAIELYFNIEEPTLSGTLEYNIDKNFFNHRKDCLYGIDTIHSVWKLFVPLLKS